jgi:large conductance mechanosensitive channel
MNLGQERTVGRIHFMFTSIKRLANQSEPTGVAAAVVIGLAMFYLINAVVADLLAPLISVFIGDPRFELNSFTISTSEFRYGPVIEAVITVVLAAAAVSLILAARQRRRAADSQTCPECASEISIAAKRCPRCTAAVQ